jgi:hypothetical protein
MQATMATLVAFPRLSGDEDRASGSLRRIETSTLM